MFTACLLLTVCAIGSERTLNIATPSRKHDAGSGEKRAEDDRGKSAIGAKPATCGYGLNARDEEVEAHDKTGATEKNEIQRATRARGGIGRSAHDFVTG